MDRTDVSFHQGPRMACLWPLSPVPSSPCPWLSKPLPTRPLGLPAPVHPPAVPRPSTPGNVLTLAGGPAAGRVRPSASGRCPARSPCPPTGPRSSRWTGRAGPGSLPSAVSTLGVPVRAVLGLAGPGLGPASVQPPSPSPGGSGPLALAAPPCVSGRAVDTGHGEPHTRLGARVRAGLGSRAPGPPFPPGKKGLGPVGFPTRSHRTEARIHRFPTAASCRTSEKGLPSGCGEAGL